MEVLFFNLSLEFTLVMKSQNRDRATARNGTSSFSAKLPALFIISI